MSLLDTIRRDSLNARRAHDPLASLYSTLVGEVEGMAKRQTPARDLSDAEVMAVVQKFVKNLDETIGHLSNKEPERAYEFIQQRNALSAYLPQQMSPEDIRAFAQSKRDEGADLGKIMSALKTEFAGKYDGKIASQIVRDVIAGTPQ